jgi:hypothetical protein
MYRGPNETRTLKFFFDTSKKRMSETLRRVMSGSELNDCMECQKFGKILTRIKETVKDAWGDGYKQKFTVEKFMPGAIKLLENTAKHCKSCVEKYDRREQGYKNLNLHFVDMKAEKAERDRHQHIANRCYEVLAKLEACKQWGGQRFHEACVKAITEA